MNRHWTTRVNSREETFEFARTITADLGRGDVIGLNGPLGAGKTIFVKGMAKALGMDDPWQELTSPTYTLQNIYPLDETLIHCDAYRLQESDQFLTLGWAEQFSEGITAIEWVDRFLPEIKTYLTAQVKIEILDKQSRDITIVSESEKMESILSQYVIEKENGSK